MHVRLRHMRRVIVDKIEGFLNKVSEGTPLYEKLDKEILNLIPWLQVFVRDTFISYQLLVYYQVVVDKLNIKKALVTCHFCLIILVSIHKY